MIRPDALCLVVDESTITEDRTMPWQKVAEPVLRAKEDGPLDHPDGKITGAGGDRTSLLLSGEFDTAARQIALWFEDLGWVPPFAYDTLPGFGGEGGQAHLQPMSMQATVHHGRLKLEIAHWHGDADARHTLYILDTGYAYVD